MATDEYTDRAYVSRYGAAEFGLRVMRAGVPGDADGAVTATLQHDNAAATEVFSRAADHPGTGEYLVRLTSKETATPGPYVLVWGYEVDSVQEEWRVWLEVGKAAPEYDRLTDEMKGIIETSWNRFSDLFDFATEGPHLQTYVQANFGRNRLAQLLRIAVGRLNTVAQPFQSYTIDGDGGASFPIERWGSLLESALYVECLRHLIRSYVEQPEVQSGSGVSRLDRRDYKDRWEDVLGVEEPVLKQQLEHFKIANMGLGRARVLVSGGVWGRWGPNRLPLSHAARPRWMTRMY
ncbi:hypothetical protein OG497_37555 [Streptomyces sp. NBC_01242]|uniref:hypothetical protein n=1 Tax=Streptomyces sp. NBC_01242 TaxID=2903795 RepID=UPI002257D02C|nr:hypothetical protein [Streptomyces sp. NBC_01242]MCX4799564.1 hypothetical protein [Streptomyces sp. NBC_01242]